MFQTFFVKFGTYFKNCRKNCNFRTPQTLVCAGTGLRRGYSACL
jgi:hypothetical protein